MAYINYQPQSATSWLSSMLGINQLADANNQKRREMIFQGIKDAGDVAGSMFGYFKRKAAIQYLGDAKLAEMKQELARLRDELTSVENQMRTIKAEDIGSLDINQDLNVPAETDVNAWSATNGRMTEYPVNTPYGTQDASMMKVGSKALGGI